MGNVPQSTVDFQVPVRGFENPDAAPGTSLDQVFLNTVVNAPEVRTGVLVAAAAIDVEETNLMLVTLLVARLLTGEIVAECECLSAELLDLCISQDAGLEFANLLTKDRDMVAQT